jgi:hypothetical protein
LSGFRLVCVDQNNVTVGMFLSSPPELQTEVANIAKGVFQGYCLLPGSTFGVDKPVLVTLSNDSYPLQTIYKVSEFDTGDYYNCPGVPAFFLSMSWASTRYPYGTNYVTVGYSTSHHYNFLGRAADGYLYILGGDQLDGNTLISDYYGEHPTNPSYYSGSFTLRYRPSSGDCSLAQSTEHASHIWQTYAGIKVTNITVAQFENMYPLSIKMR